MTFKRQPRQTFVKPENVKSYVNLDARIDRLLAIPEVSASGITFLEGLKDFNNRRGGLTESQFKAFNRMESRFTDEGRERLEAWRLDYETNYKKDFLVLIDFQDFQNKMNHTRYFDMIIERVHSDPTYLPEEANTKKMFRSRYYRNVLDEYKKAPVYPVNTLVQIRAVIKHKKNKFGAGLGSDIIQFIEKPAIVVNTEPRTPKSSAKGAKLYRILPAGSAVVFEIEERYLKPFRKKNVAEVTKLIKKEE